MFYLLLVVNLRFVVHPTLKLIFTISIANFTNAIITLRSPFAFIVAALIRVDRARER